MILGNDDNRHIRRCHRPEDLSITFVSSFLNCLIHIHDGGDDNNGEDYDDDDDDDDDVE